jgi:hypothetical protein
VVKNGKQLVSLYQRILSAIRAQDPHHLVFLEGGKFAMDFSMFDRPLDSNQAYEFHLYNWFGDDRAKRLARYRRLSEQQNVPLWCGEFGENKPAMVKSTAEMFDDPANVVSGWAYWPWKKVPGSFSSVVSIAPPEAWRASIRSLSGWGWKHGDPERLRAGMDAFLKAASLAENKENPEIVDALTLPVTASQNSGRPPAPEKKR